MSRSSKGFADFFPTAPSVLQQKRSKAAQLRKKEISPSKHDTKLADTSATVLDNRHDQTSNLNNSHHNDTRAELASNLQYENEVVPGDLLNGVGSASSTSTASSIFSTTYHVRNVAHSKEANTSKSLTPLTTSDSSPPEKNSGSPHRHQAEEKDAYRFKPSRTQHYSNAADAAPQCGLQISQLPSISEARPGSGQVKGFKAVYDPDLDKKLTSKERKGRQVRYKAFGEV